MLGRLCEVVREAWQTVRETGKRDNTLLYNGEPMPEESEFILPEDLSGWDLTGYFGNHWKNLLTEPDFYPKTRPVEGARKGVHTLWGLGYRVVYVTSCIPGTADAKQEWLLKWGFLTPPNAIRDFIVVGDKSMVKADVLFDDAVHNVDPFPGAAFLVEHWHNRVTPCARPRIRGLFDAPRVLAKLGM